MQLQLGSMQGFWRSAQSKLLPNKQKGFHHLIRASGKRFTLGSRLLVVRSKQMEEGMEV